MGKPDSTDTYTQAETEARREAALKRMLNTPHKPQEKLKKGEHGKAKRS